MCRQDRKVERMRRVYETSRILNDVVDALLQDASPEDAVRLQDTDVWSLMHTLFTSSLEVKLDLFYACRAFVQAFYTLGSNQMTYILTK